MSDFASALATTQRTAYHLEQRDAYGFAEPDRASFEAYMAGRAPDTDPEGEYWGGWTRTVREAIARGVEFRRLRIVSEPVSDYIRWEHTLTRANVAAGEKVRWLPRSACVDLALVPVDFWVFDSASVLFGHFAGNGKLVRHELRTEPEVAKLAAESFEAAWVRALPHDQYDPE